MKISRNKYVLVDDDIFTLLAGKWTANSGGKNFYACRKRSGTKKHEYMHRIIANAKDGESVDHINGNTLDNRRSNLRICDAKQNIYNKKKAGGNNTSKYKGVSLRRSNGKWLAQVQKENERKSKTFNTELEAAEYYNTEAKKYFGEFAKLNIIPKVVESD